MKISHLFYILIFKGDMKSISLTSDIKSISLINVETRSKVILLLR